MIGRVDQKFAPRVACRVVMRISTAGSGRSASCFFGGELSHLREYHRNFVRKNEDEIVVLHVRHRVIECLPFIVNNVNVLSAQSSLT